jgi:hypothetical protein
LHGYAFIETENDTDKLFFQKITKIILIQIKNMIRFNSARCEQLAILEGIPILSGLAIYNLYNHILIPIFSDIISSSRFARDCLKKVNALELILNFINNKSYKEFFSEMIKNLLIWLQNDKIYVESFILHENNFSNIFLDIHENLSIDLIDYLSVLLNIFDLSGEIERKYFDDQNLVKLTWDSLVGSNFLKSNDILLMNKIVDFFDLFVENKRNDHAFIKEINFLIILDNIKSVTKENNLIIVDEKLKKIYEKFK